MMTLRATQEYPNALETNSNSSEISYVVTWSDVFFQCLRIGFGIAAVVMRVAVVSEFIYVFVTLFRTVNCIRGRHGGLMVMRSTPERVIRFRALAGDIVLCSWASYFTLTKPLSTQV